MSGEGRPSAQRRVAPASPGRRGWCPSLGRPMATGDGLLARIHPPLGILTPEQVRAVAEGARRYGNGHVDLTGRANLQVRGVSEETAAPLACFLAEAGLGDTRDDGGPQRVTLTSPLAGLAAAGTCDTTSLAGAIEAAALALPGLPAKTLVALAGPGLGAADADIVLTPLPDGRVAVALARPDGTPAADLVAAPEAAPALVAHLLAGLVASTRRRLRDLSDAERAALLEDALRRPGAGILPPDGNLAVPAFAAVAAGSLSVAEGLFAVAAEAPFGRASADGLDALARVAATLARPDIRTAPTRGFVLVCPDEPAAKRSLAELAEAGFVTRADDPRRAVAACPGAPACASGSTPTLADAARLAEAFRPLAEKGLRAHVSGCAKGCAQPGPADLTLVGTGGRYDVVLGAAPDGLPTTRLTIEAALERVRRAASTLTLNGAFGTGS